MILFRINDEKLLQKYKGICNNIEDLKHIELNDLPLYNGLWWIKSGKWIKTDNNGFKLQDFVCNDCHVLAILSVNIITIKNVCYRCDIHNISKSEEINLLENSVHKNCGYI